MKVEWNTVISFVIASVIVAVLVPVIEKQVSGVNKTSDEDKFSDEEY